MHNLMEMLEMAISVLQDGQKAFGLHFKIYNNKVHNIYLAIYL